MEPITVTGAWLLAMLLLPLLVLLWLTESQEQRMCRFSRKGWSEQRIADQQNISHWHRLQGMTGGQS